MTVDKIPPAVTLYWQEERIKELEAALARLTPGEQLLNQALAERTVERDQLRAALKQYGQHAYACSSEHGRYPKRCSCGFDIALML